MDQVTERPAWQQRVLDERFELDVKLSKLDAALKAGNASWGPQDMFLLSKQSNAMTEYLDILDARIALW